MEIWERGLIQMFAKHQSIRAPLVQIQLSPNGSMAERSNAFVLKTKGPLGSVGSNPTTSAVDCQIGNLLMI